MSCLTHHHTATFPSSSDTHYQEGITETPLTLKFKVSLLQLLFSVQVFICNFVYPMNCFLILPYIPYTSLSRIQTCVVCAWMLCVSLCLYACIIPTHMPLVACLLLNGCCYVPPLDSLSVYCIVCILNCKCNRGKKKGWKREGERSLVEEGLMGH